MGNCELCKFNNPKGTATAIIIKDNRLLTLKRKDDPFKNYWDLPGGYMNQNETPEQTVIREIREELNVDVLGIVSMKTVPGTAFWKNNKFAVIAHFFLVDIGGQKIRLNDESLEYKWISLKDLDPASIAFDSNVSFIDSYLKPNFVFDLGRISELVRQLDSSAEIKEQSLYRAVLCGYVSKIYEGDQLVAMGWIFPRQTMLRNQYIIEDMICDESYRGRGYGQRVLDDLINWAKETGCEVIELTTNPKRVAAHKLYEKNGFKLHPTDHMLLDLRSVKK